MEGDRMFIIAEIGINHNGDMELAKKMILAAKKSGASAVKFQSWQTTKLTAKNSSQTTKNKDNLGCSDEIYELFKKVEFKKNQHFEISDFCKKNEIS